MIKFILGALTALLLISMVNCSGTLPKKPQGMKVIRHTVGEQMIIRDPETGEVLNHEDLVPCKPLDE